MNTTAELTNSTGVVEQLPRTVPISTLLRYEWQRTRKIVLGVPGIALLVALLSGLGMRLADVLSPGPEINFIGGLFFVTLLVAVVGPAAVTPLLLAVDYWRSAYGSTGYFTQTIPARGRTQYFVRLGYGSAVVLVTLGLQVLIAAISVALLPRVARADLWDAGMKLVLEEAYSLGVLWVPIVLVIAEALLSLIQLYFVASYGSESLLGRFGVGGPILAWIGLYVINQIVTMVALFAVPAVLVPEIVGERVVFHLEAKNLFAALLANQEPSGMPIGFVAWAVALTVILIARTAYSWEKRIALR